MMPVTIENVRALNLRIGKVLSVEAHPNADRLYVLRVDLGEEAPRTLVAGIRQWYAPEQLTGKSVVVVADLEPAVIRGVTSQGMILAAKDGDTLNVLTTDNALAPGSQVS